MFEKINVFFSSLKDTQKFPDDFDGVVSTLLYTSIHALIMMTRTNRLLVRPPILRLVSTHGGYICTK